MSAAAIPAATLASGEEIAERTSSLDWDRVSRDLDATGNAMIEGLATSSAAAS